MGKSVTQIEVLHTFK